MEMDKKIVINYAHKKRTSAIETGALEKLPYKIKKMIVDAIIEDLTKQDLLGIIKTIIWR